MASSYAALVSLHTIIDTIQNHHNPPISLDRFQAESLLEKLTFLQQFLQLHSHLEEYPTQHVETIIKQAVYDVEDVIESFIVDRIEESISLHNNQVHRFDLCIVIEKMDIIKKQAMEIKKILGGVDDHRPIRSMPAPSVVSPSPSLGQNITMVGFDEFLEDILHRLTRDESRLRQMISIIGMGGIGKTTLAAKAYQHGLVKHHFDISVWVTISQKYKIRDILLEILLQIIQAEKDYFKNETEQEIGLRIHKNFSCRRYLVVMDDMWSPEPLNRIRCFFPENHNGSRIVITTRVSNVAAPSSSSIQMNLLDEDKSWDLFCKTVFPEGVYPLELEELGKNIARNCKGLPLSIVVIGGFLSKSEQTTQHWECVARNLSSIVNLEDNERCLKILYLSYRQLPIHLKPCFLYMGLFPEDERIRVSYLVKLLVAEGFLKPIDGKPLEAVAEIYIRDLVDRNLLLVDQWGSIGSIKSCKIHHLLRDLCVKEARKENFMCLVEENNLHIQDDMNTQRRIAVHRILLYKEYPFQANEKLQSASLARSLTWEFQESLPSFKFKLLWTLNASHTYLNEANSNCESIFQLYNLRFVGFGLSSHYQATMLSCMSLIWNLQTLIIGASYTPIYGAVEIWKMPQLRHVKVHCLEFAPPNHNCVLNNLQTLCKVSEFECSREVVDRLPNIQKLAINVGLDLQYGLKNLEHLHKLEHLQCEIWPMRICKFDLQQNISLPRSLKKLSLGSTVLRWEDVTPMVGSLPCLEKLTLRWTSGSEWRPTTGQFLSLKFLGVYGCVGLEHWIADSSQFPVLERLILKGLRKLAEIPLDIGEIPTLELIEVEHCSDSAVISAKAIAKEHDEIGDSQLQIHVSARKDSQLESLASLASQNFQVKIDEVKNG